MHAKLRTLLQISFLQAKQSSHCDSQEYEVLPIKSQMSRAFATETVDMDSIPGWVKPKLIKIGIHNFSA